MFDIHKIYTDVVGWLVVTVVGGGAAWIMALRREVNTNGAQIKQDRSEHQKQLALIMQRLDQRDMLREEDRNISDKLGIDVRELRQDVRDIKNALIGQK